jgi:glutamate racemase
MHKNEYPIGIFDSGVGGLSILTAINKLMPKENLIYLADSLHMPYGEKSERQIKTRVLSAAEHFVKHDVKAMVIACNTATAAAVNQLRENYNIPIIGLEPAIKPAIEHSASKRIGVLATSATLISQKYIDLKKQYGNGVEIIEKASPLFVDIVESAPTIDEEKRRLIEKELSSFISQQIDCLVLGCTHYPFLTETISQIMGEQVILFESGMPVAQELKRRMQNRLNGSNRKNYIKYYSSAPDAAQTSFNNIIGYQVELCEW